jgi:micrococcal nuclease
VASVLLVAATGCASDPVDTDGRGLRAVVTSVIDGDTIVVRTGSRRETVRLIGVDTPETKHPDRPVECGGPEASARTAGLLPRGTPVRLVRDDEARDVHGRLLAYVWRDADGLFVNLDLVASGHARPLPYPPNTSHAALFAAAARQAETAGLGLWAACRG